MRSCHSQEVQPGSATRLRVLIVDRDERIWVVDWDEATVAPKERDLMFAVGGISRSLVSAAETGAFLAGYGDADVDSTALAYYRAAWAVQDIAAFAKEALPAQLAALFRPGEIVELALEG